MKYFLLHLNSHTLLRVMESKYAPGVRRSMLILEESEKYSYQIADNYSTLLATLIPTLNQIRFEPLRGWSPSSKRTNVPKHLSLCKIRVSLYENTSVCPLDPHLLRSSSTSISSSSAGLKYSATIDLSSCSRSGFSMNLTVPSRPLSPIRPLVPFARPGVEGEAVFGDSFGEALVPLEGLEAPFVTGGFFRSFHSVKRGRCLASISWLRGIRTSRKTSMGKSGPTVVLFR
jgi:hypothetical protein